MIDVEALRTRYHRIAGFLDERERRLFAANEALGLDRGGVTAVFAASGIARSTINRGTAELRRAELYNQTKQETSLQQLLRVRP